MVLGGYPATIHSSDRLLPNKTMYVFGVMLRDLYLPRTGLNLKTKTLK